MLQPIHYSLILNVATIAAGTFLSWVFGNAFVLVVLLLIANHAVALFPDPAVALFPDPAKRPPPERAGGIGFMANVDDDYDD